MSKSTQSQYTNRKGSNQILEDSVADDPTKTEFPIFDPCIEHKGKVNIGKHVYISALVSSSKLQVQ
jgi:hypothetical protein